MLSKQEGDLPAPSSNIWDYVVCQEFNDISTIRATINEYQAATRHSLKECKEKRKHSYIITYRCCKNNAKDTACKFNIKFYWHAATNCWQIHKTMNLSHNHQPFDEATFIRKRRNKLTLKEGIKLEILIWSYINGAHYTMRSIKDDMENSFPEHGDFALSKIKNAAYKLRKTLKSRRRHNRLFDVSQHIDNLLLEYSKLEREDCHSSIIGLDVNLEGSEDSMDTSISPVFTNGLKNSEMTPIHLSSFDDMASNAFDKDNYN